MRMSHYFIAILQPSFSSTPASGSRVSSAVSALSATSHGSVSGSTRKLKGLCGRNSDLEFKEC